jgi:uncharacterized protein (TIGR01777 family)
MKIVIPGGSGQVGNTLARAFSAGGHEVVVLSRAPAAAPWRTVAWDAQRLGPWASEIDGADVVINLAGRNVNCRYTPENRRLIMDSRVLSTQAVGAAIARAAQPPRVWLQASTATIYAHRYDAANDEHTGLIGGHEPDAPAAWRFSIDVATAWEAAARASANARTRLVLLRSSIILGPERDGIFDVLLRLARFGLGGASADGRQYISWVHDQDFVAALQWLIDHDELSGAVNIAAPNPLPQAEFMRHLRAAWGMPIGLPATRWMLALGARVLGTETELILKSRRVVPTRLLESGFQFQYHAWPEAARDLVGRWRGLHEEA